MLILSSTTFGRESLNSEIDKLVEPHLKETAKALSNNPSFSHTKVINGRLVVYLKGDVNIKCTDKENCYREGYNIDEPLKFMFPNKKDLTTDGRVLAHYSPEYHKQNAEHAAFLSGDDVAFDSLSGCFSTNVNTLMKIWRVLSSNKEYVTVKVCKDGELRTEITSCKFGSSRTGCDIYPIELTSEGITKTTAIVDSSRFTDTKIYKREKKSTSNNSKASKK